jgi:hypothetical protein
MAMTEEARMNTPRRSGVNSYSLALSDPHFRLTRHCTGRVIYPPRSLYDVP